MLSRAAFLKVLLIGLWLFYTYSVQWVFTASKVGSCYILTFPLMSPGSWFIPRQRRIGRYDSSSFSCPPQPLQPRPSWCPFSWDLSWRHLSSFVAVDLASSRTLGFPCESLSLNSMVIHSWKMSKPSQTFASDKIFQLWKCSCLSDFLICYIVLPGNPQDTSLPSVMCCLSAA